MLDRFVQRLAAGHLVRLVALTAALLLAALPLPAVAQQQQQQATPCVDCVLYAYTDLNLRKAPSLEAVVVARVPKAAAVRRTAGAEMNGYAPVTYAGIPGWVVALGLVVSPADVEPDIAPAPTATAPSAPTPTPAVPPAIAPNERVALAPLNLRAGSGPDAVIVTTIPTGGVLTLTGEGAEGGYVTAVYGDATGWVYADLIGVP